MAVAQAETIERKTSRVAELLLLFLAVYIFADAGRRLLGFGVVAKESLIGIILTTISVVVMPIVAWAKLRAATALDSRALRTDAYETVAAPGCRQRPWAGSASIPRSAGREPTRSLRSSFCRSSCAEGLEGLQQQQDWPGDWTEVDSQTDGQRTTTVTPLVATMAQARCSAGSPRRADPQLLPIPLVHQAHY